MSLITKHSVLFSFLDYEDDSDDDDDNDDWYEDGYDDDDCSAQSLWRSSRVWYITCKKTNYELSGWHMNKGAVTLRNFLSNFRYF